MRRNDEPSYGRTQVRRRRLRTTAWAVAFVLGAAVSVCALVGYDRGYAADTVTGKHHAPESNSCSSTACVTEAERWQLDVLSGRRANTIDVDKTTFDRYKIGDAYER